MLKKVLAIGILSICLLAIFLIINRSKPQADKMQTKQIKIDSITVTGPVVFIYDKSSRENYWLKSYTTLDAQKFDSLTGRTVIIHFMKAFAGPLENRIFKIQADSVFVFDQDEKN
ncbi:MAG: hypothetical protein HOP08_01270 [Cyclobacteriaceae bacterium]|nr:hypothetical protein [Cyclobacteriaceae bacterium]